MPLLEAFLALALTLLSLAMIATLVVELVHRLAGTRSKNLKMMLEKYYDLEIKPRVDAEPKNGDETAPDPKEAFIKTLINNPLIEDGESAGLIQSRLKEFAGLSTDDLFKKLACTEIGKRIKAKTEAEIDEAVDSLSRSYDAFGVAATDLFKRRAQITSLWVGVLVAFALNANALSIFRSYLGNPQARAEAVAQADAVLDSFTERIDTPQGFQSNEEVLDHVNAIKNEVKGLTAMGVPFGYAADKMPVKRPGNPTFWRWLEIVFWAMGVFATGLLIGLGGPFWFNIVRKLTDVLQVARGGTPTTAEPDNSSGPPGSSIKSYRDTFKLTGGPSPLVQAQANLTVASEAATAADRAVIVAADALMSMRNAVGDTPSGPMKTAIADAEKALKMATDAQKKAYKNKKAAEQFKTDTDSKRTGPVVPGKL